MTKKISISHKVSWNVFIESKLEKVGVNMDEIEIPDDLTIDVDDIESDILKIPETMVTYSQILVNIRTKLGRKEAQKQNMFNKGLWTQLNSDNRIAEWKAKAKIKGTGEYLEMKQDIADLNALEKQLAEFIEILKIKSQVLETYSNY